VNRQQITGSVIKEPFAKGSKSEREAVILVADDQRYVLRRQGGNAFQDSVLEKLVGQKIEGTGTLAGYTFLLSDWTVLPSAR
jgi:hypothetical protein